MSTWVQVSNDQAVNLDRVDQVTVTQRYGAHVLLLLFQDDSVVSIKYATESAARKHYWGVIHAHATGANVYDATPDAL